MTSRIAACLLLVSLTPCCAEPAPAIHYAPGENLEHVDVALIDSAQHEIDMAAYVLTEWPVMQALTRAADRGVAIRIYLDGKQLAEREPAKVSNDLAETPGVEIRIKRTGSDPMHLKSYHAVVHQTKRANRLRCRTGCHRQLQNRRGGSRRGAYRPISKRYCNGLTN